MPGRRPRKPSAAEIALEILVEAGDWPPPAALEDLTKGVVAAAVAAVRPPLAEGAELSLVFTDDAHIRALNRRFRRLDRPTNVLSFPAPMAENDRFGPLLGDIALARETIRHEAEAEGLTFEGHVSHLILHGFLHILGYDHEEETTASDMERLETAILGGLGIADPYAEHSERPKEAPDTRR